MCIFFKKSTTVTSTDQSKSLKDFKTTFLTAAEMFKNVSFRKRNWLTFDVKIEYGNRGDLLIMRCP